MTADLSALIARLEAAEVGSRELDCRVVAWSEGVIEGEHWSDDDLEYALTDPDRTCDPEHVTTSLDAALALASRLELHGDRLLFEVLEAGEFRSDRLSLALVISILRAKQGEGE